MKRSISPKEERMHEAIIAMKKRKKKEQEEEEEEEEGVVSTTLRLYSDPWKIKKTLTDSDLGMLSRLLVSTEMVKTHILPSLSEDEARAADTEEGTLITIRDLDSESMHQLVLKRWCSSKSYVFIGKWNREFVRRRQLNKGDQIGLYWDPFHSFFNFCVLARATPIL